MADPEYYKSEPVDICKSGIGIEKEFSWNELFVTICNAHLRMMGIVPRWPGSSHDQTIYNNSRVKRRLQDNEFGTFEYFNIFGRQSVSCPLKSSKYTC
ncbi:hypothetical protein NQ318_007494 [Aromia moschata]|uniref:DDE Tnp4 domain-containing protein n=1 Tax=Aromia moschata TaxID=1265417 RepID=A0AAV8YFR4_9CUCU|nr:hypothetical protein NQ318_007494 [Aromia moschata]